MLVSTRWSNVLTTARMDISDKDKQTTLMHRSTNFLNEYRQGSLIEREGLAQLSFSLR
jgi:hypothetical protein